MNCLFKARTMVDVFVFVLVVLLAILPASAKYSGGSGLSSEPYRICTPNDLNDIGSHIDDWDKHFKLFCDIDLGEYGGTEFNVIGNNVNAFAGVFDGNGHTISDFSYVSTGTNNIGLFGYVDSVSSEIRNVGLIDPNVDAGTGNYAGSLVGYLKNGSVVDCYCDGGSVSGDWYVGVVIGINRSDAVSSCWASGDATANHHAGGLIGYNNGSVSESYASGRAISNNDYAGGLVGLNSLGTISKCYASGDASAETSSAGGLVGYNNYGAISNCYARGDANSSDFAGGLIGKNYSGTVTNCYAKGYVSANDFAGGLVGGNAFGTYVKSFWDSDVNYDVNGIGDDVDPNVISKTTAGMKTEATYTDAGWDFDTPVWKICDGENYPKLSWDSGLAGDLVCPEGVNFLDFAELGLALYSEAGDENWNAICDISDPNDNVIDELDLRVFVNDWLCVE